MTDREKYACPNCGAAEYLTALNAYDIYAASGDELHLQNRETADDEFKLFCRACSARAPLQFENAARQ